MKKLYIVLCLVVSAGLANAAIQNQANPDKPSRLYVETDTQGFNYNGNGISYDYYNGAHILVGTASGVQNYNHTWTDGAGGGGSWSSDHTDSTISDNPLYTGSDHYHVDGQFSWAPTDWPTLTNCTETLTGDTWLLGWADIDVGLDPWQSDQVPLIQMEHCQIKDTKSTWTGTNNYSHYDFKRTAQTKMKLQTGGKALSKQQNLFVVSGSATAILANFAIPPFVNLPTQPISAQSVVIGSLGSLGSDGNRYVALPDNASPDVTPSVAGQKFYTFNVSAQKCKLHILANENPLSDDHVRSGAYFCVGQKLNFQALFSPAPSGLNYTSPTWNYTADYVNNHYTDSHDCEIYNIAPIPAMSNPTVAWFYNKKTQDATANLGLYCKFNNGQSVYLVRQGMFNVFTPSIAFIPSGGFTVNVRHYGAAVLFGVGQDDGTGGLGMQANINSIPKFPGQAIATQLINRQASIDSIPFGTGGTNDLDNTEIYPGSQSSMTNDPNNAHSNLLGTVRVIDQPGIPITVASWASGNDQFNTYFRFRPDGDSDNIYVTLGRADWSWHGNVLYTGGIPYNPWTLTNWTISGAGTSGPAFNQVNDFPVWAAIYSNFP